MWATSSPSQAEQNTRRGFTIVELLVVIVVIAILAAIVIVAYNGITQRARVATVSSDLEGAAKQLAIDQTLNSAYPATVAAANNGVGLKASTGTTYQYAVNNTVSPQTFCITATNGTTSYYASSTNNVPTVGACAGQGSGGVAAITNLITNPSLETNSTGWSDQWFGSGGGDGALQLTGSAAIYGTAGYRKTWTVAGGGQDVGMRYTLPATVGKTYTFSAYIRASVTTNHKLYVLWIDASNGNIGSLVQGPETTIPQNVWQRLSLTATAPASTVSVAIIWGPYPSSGSPTSVVGQTIDFDGLMMTEGSTLYTYADGSSPNWIWNGTPNASTSTGPPL